MSAKHVKLDTNYFYNITYGSENSAPFNGDSLIFFKIAENQYMIGKKSDGSIIGLENVPTEVITVNDSTYSKVTSFTEADKNFSPVIFSILWVEAKNHYVLKAHTTDGKMEGYLDKVEGKAMTTFADIKINWVPSHMDLTSESLEKAAKWNIWHNNKKIPLPPEVETVQPKFDPPTISSTYAPEFSPKGEGIGKLTHEELIPYFFVNDPTMPTWAERIKKTPYYKVQQYTRLKLLKGPIVNGSSMDTTMSEQVTFGISKSEAKTFSVSVGISIGFSEEVDAGMLFVNSKTTFSATLSTEFGYSSTQTTSTSTAQTETVNIPIPSKSATALYSYYNTYRLFQTGNPNAIASPPVGIIQNRGKYFFASAPLH